MLLSSSLYLFVFYFFILLTHNSLQDVAVKILMEQDFHAERFKEFLREVYLKVLTMFYAEKTQVLFGYLLGIDLICILTYLARLQ